MENRPVPHLAVLISGRGSNLAAIAEAIDAGSVPAAIAVVISNRADAPGLALARARGIPAVVLPHTGFGSRDAYDAALVAALQPYGPRFVCLAGFMRRLGPAFCEAFPRAILNIHPSLLPAFPGVDAQRQAFEDGAKVTGATVHFVIPELDAGPVILQATVPIEDADSVETLSARILVEEHRLYPEAIRRLLTEDWRIEGRRVLFGPPARTLR